MGVGGVSHSGTGLSEIEKLDTRSFLWGWSRGQLATDCLVYLHFNDSLLLLLLLMLMIMTVVVMMMMMMMLLLPVVVVLLVLLLLLLLMMMMMMIRWWWWCYFCCCSSCWRFWFCSVVFLLELFFSFFVLLLCFPLSFPPSTPSPLPPRLSLSSVFLSSFWFCCCVCNVSQLNTVRVTRSMQSFIVH